MLRPRVPVLVAVVIGLLGPWILTSGASARPTRCTIQLRVNVFGASSPQSHWALQGGLNAGKLATLRAVSHGCNLHHITGRWVSGGEGAFPGSRRACAGTVCVWYVRAPFMSAADFQAFGPAAGGVAPRSNIVRVAWAGSAVVGRWNWAFARPGATCCPPGGTVTFSDDHTMTWDGGDSGTWEQAGTSLTLRWKSGSIDRMRLSQDGRRMTGTNNTGWSVRGTR